MSRPPSGATPSWTLIRPWAFPTSNFGPQSLLPENDVFDDPRYFEPSDVRRMFEIGGRKIGVVVCEDFWNDKTFWKERLYDTDPADELIMQGADLIVAVNASPFNKGKIKLVLFHQLNL